MEKLLETILSNSTYLMIALSILAIILFLIIKKIFKLLIYAVVLFIIYLGYVYYTGGDVAEKVVKAKEKGEEVIQSGKKKVDVVVKYSEELQKLNEKTKK